MIESLPSQDQELVYELVKKMVLAWDPDYTKVTNEEARQIDESEKSGFVDDDEINWDL